MGRKKTKITEPLQGSFSSLFQKSANQKAVLPTISEKEFKEKLDTFIEKKSRLSHVEGKKIEEVIERNIDIPTESLEKSLKEKGKKKS